MSTVVRSNTGGVPIPLNMSLSSWAASLVQSFPEDNVPFLSDESSWKEWGNNLIQLKSFSNNGAPNTSSFSDWKIWASFICKAMANS
jgi:hypothetical protein